MSYTRYIGRCEIQAQSALHKCLQASTKAHQRPLRLLCRLQQLGWEAQRQADEGSDCQLAAYT